MIKSAYTEKIKIFDGRIFKLRRIGRFYFLGKLLTFSAFCLSLYIIHPSYLSCKIALPALFLVGYIAQYILDEKCSKKMERLQRKRKICSHELACLSGDFSPFDSGEKYVDSQHEYSYDLDIFGHDSLYNRINRTVTRVGSDILAKKLTALSASADDIRQNRQAIQELARLDSLRLSFLANDYLENNRSFLSGGGDKNKYGKIFVDTCVPYIFLILTLLLLLLAIFGVLSFAYFAVAFIIQFFLTMLVSKYLTTVNADAEFLHKEFSGYVNLLETLATVPFHSAKLKKIHRSLFGENSAAEAFGQLSGILSGFNIKANAFVYLLLNGLFLYDVFLIRRFVLWQKKYLQKSDEWLTAIGEIDALMSLAVFAYNNPQNKYPDIIEDDSSDDIIVARGIFHPFIGCDSAVANDFILKRNGLSVVTGANMAGKSTFLRTVGVTFVLAQAGCPVCAEYFAFSCVSLFTSMRTSDNLSDNISYFHAELLRLQQLVEHLKKHRHTLVILDEILKGTNSKDKLNGSILFLDFLSKLDCSALIATHDLELATHFDNREHFDNYCFEIDLSENVEYSYKIQKGIARNMNASFLLNKMLGGDSALFPLRE